jgi:thioredoxin reductase (NADPH)
MPTSNRYDCVIVGGGPAGLTAAVYLCRFRRKILVIDAFESRARYIPTSHNCPGFPDGISGTDLLITLRKHARKFGAESQRGTVLTLRRHRDRFLLNTAQEEFESRTVLLATGIVDILPKVRGIHAAIHRGVVRLCPICDGFEASGQRIAVLGPPRTVIGHAKFLLLYSNRVTAVLSEIGTLTRSDAARARALGIPVIGHEHDIRFSADGCVITHSAGTAEFDCLYPTMGFKPKCRLAASLGAKVDAQDEIVVDRHMQTSISGLFGAGDAVSGLHQISVSTGQAAIAATAIHNQLTKNESAV